MSAKVERVCKEIEKTKSKMGELSLKLRELEKQKTELENMEIVEAVRGMNITLDDLATMLKNTTSGQIVPKSKPQNDKEDND